MMIANTFSYKFRPLLAGKEGNSALNFWLKYAHADHSNYTSNVGSATTKLYQTIQHRSNANAVKPQPQYRLNDKQAMTARD